MARAAGINLPSLRRYPEKLQRQTGLVPQLIDCCRKMCMAYTGNYAEATECEHCQSPRRRRKRNGTLVPIAQFMHLPIAFRLQYQYSIAGRAKLLKATPSRYINRAESCYDDWWSGTHFQDLRRQGLFASNRDVALQISYDGFQVNVRGQHHAIPIIAINLNLPPTIRYRRENILVVGLIPGPKSPIMIDTFLQPLVDEMKVLQNGIDGVFDADAGQEFMLHAHVVLFSGDGPAVSQAAGMKAPGNARIPCRVCTFEGTAFRLGPANRVRYYYPHSNNDLCGVNDRGISLYRHNLRHVINVTTRAGDSSMASDGMLL